MFNIRVNFCLLLAVLMIGAVEGRSQVTIGSNSPADPAAVLDLQSQSKGLLIPRMTTAQRDAILNPPEGLLIFVTDSKCLQLFDGTAWTGCTSPNAAPLAFNVTVSGSAAQGATLTGSYGYADAESDPQGTSTFKWYRADNAAGLNVAAISGATSQTYVLTGADVNKFIRFAVTPVATTGTRFGSEARSVYLGAIAGNAAPVASNVAQSGTAVIGSMLTGSYTYSDAESNPQGASTFKWYRADNASGLNEAAIAGATSSSYTLTATDVGKYVRFAVTPVATAGTLTGLEVKAASFSGPVLSNAAPVASSVSQTGSAVIGTLLTGTYTYSDAENNPQGTSTFKWYRADNASGLNEAAIAGATSLTYTLTLADAGKFIRFAVTPVATTGTITGVEVKAGSYVGSVTSFTCGTSTVTFTYKGSTVTYGTLSYAGKCWIDRNLGASQVATSTTDAASYGDYFQWGRWDDGHQSSTSSTLGCNNGCATPATPPAANTFYTGQGDWWNGSALTDTWSGTTASGTNGKDPCQALGSAWHLPTVTDMQNVVSAIGAATGQAARMLANLKGSLAGSRLPTGSVVSVATFGGWWTSNTAGNNGSSQASILQWAAGNSILVDMDIRKAGYPVRCVR